jgi:hypothetical protein
MLYSVWHIHKGSVELFRDYGNCCLHLFLIFYTCGHYRYLIDYFRDQVRFDNYWNDAKLFYCTIELHMRNFGMYVYHWIMDMLFRGLIIASSPKLYFMNTLTWNGKVQLTVSIRLIFWT